MQGLSLRFVRWGAGLLVLGLLTGYGPLGHYLMGGVKVRCPWAPVHAHVVLLGWVAFTLFGLVYRALPEWGSPTATTVKLATVHFWLSVVSVLGVYANGTFGYRLLDRMSPRFYYRPDEATLRLWLTIDGGLLTLFAVGCTLFIWVLFGITKPPAREA
jgi:heme/copper-type cytochrome/quinol oxidase subunit 1